MWLVWETKVVEVPLYKKLVGMKYKNKRPTKVILRDDEYDQLTKDGEKGTRYASFLKGVICRT
jgi:hypothetical protein